MNTVFITGCSSGFGRLAALRFARGGDTVWATMRNTAKAGPLTEAAEHEDLDIHVLELDVTDPASIERATKQALAQGPVDVLVNNAGIELRSPVELADDDEVLRQFDTNVFGLLRVTRAVLPSMRERRQGTIVNVSSIAGLVPRPFGGLYAASKHAVEAISATLTLELHPFGIRVAQVEPGQYATEFTNNILTARRFTPDTPYWDTAERFDSALHKLAPGGQPSDPAEVAEAIVEAAYGEPRLQRPVGADAELIAGARASMDWEDFEHTMRTTLDFWE